MRQLLSQFYGIHPTLGGYIQVWYMGHCIAVVDEEGQIVLQQMRIPTYLIEYILLQPRPEDTKWN